MFADTITITINSVAKVLNRIADDGYTSEYYLRGTTDEFRMKIRHSSYLAKDRGNVRVDRHNVEFTQRVYAVAPATVDVVRKSYIILENNANDGVTDPLNFNLGFVAFFNSGNVTKLINFES
jgi:hypothetical protein